MPAQAGIHLTGWQDHGLDSRLRGNDVLFLGFISLKSRGKD